MKLIFVAALFALAFVAFAFEAQAKRLDPKQKLSFRPGKTREHVAKDEIDPELISIKLDTPDLAECDIFLLVLLRTATVSY